MVPAMIDALSLFLAQIRFLLYRRIFLHGYLQILHHFCQARIGIRALGHRSHQLFGAAEK